MFKWFSSLLIKVLIFLLTVFVVARLFGLLSCFCVCYYYTYTVYLFQSPFLWAKKCITKNVQLTTIITITLDITRNITIIINAIKYNCNYKYNYNYSIIWIIKMTDNLILYELQKIHEALTKTKEHTLNFRLIKSTEKFNFSEPILNTTKLGLIRLTVYNSVFNVNRSNNQFLYEDNSLTVIPGADELTELAEFIEETNGNVFIEPDKNTMKCLMEIKQSSLWYRKIDSPITGI